MVGGKKGEKVTNVYLAKHGREFIFSNSSGIKTSFLPYSHYIPNKLNITI